LGFDFDHYTGAEARVGLSKLELFSAENFPLDQTSDIGLFDVSLLYYPWGDSRWRPYFSLGLGVGAFNLYDELGHNYNDGLLIMPFGGGMKYYYQHWCVWRVEVLDNLTFGQRGIDTMNNLSICASWEFRFGANPKLYYPVHPGINRW